MKPSTSFYSLLVLTVKKCLRTRCFQWNCTASYLGSSNIRQCPVAILEAGSLASLWIH
jgi:hypothetical protein